MTSTTNKFNNNFYLHTDANAVIKRIFRFKTFGMEIIVTVHTGKPTKAASNSVPDVTMETIIPSCNEKLLQNYNSQTFAPTKAAKTSRIIELSCYVSACLAGKII